MRCHCRSVLPALPVVALVGTGLMFAVGLKATPPPADDKPREPSPAVTALAEALADMDTDVRKNAAASLGRIGKDAKAAVPALAAALADAEADVRGAAALALGRIGK